MKRNLVGIFALVLAIGFSSFTSKRALDKWFRYDGTDNSAAQVLDPTKYTDLNTTVPSNPADVDLILAFIHVEVATEVYATTPQRPKVDIATAIQSDLSTNVVGKAIPTEVSNRIYIK